MRWRLPRRFNQWGEGLHKPDVRQHIKGLGVRVYAMKTRPRSKTEAHDDPNPNGIPLLHAGQGKLHAIPVLFTVHGAAGWPKERWCRQHPVFQ